MPEGVPAHQPEPAADSRLRSQLHHPQVLQDQGVPDGDRRGTECVQGKTVIMKENRPELGNERREYLKAIQSQAADLVEEKKFYEFITAIGSSFDEVVTKFIR